VDFAATARAGLAKKWEYKDKIGVVAFDQPVQI
jgi:hypothetical protein